MVSRAARFARGFRIAVLLATLALGIGVVACGGSSSDDAEGGKVELSFLTANSEQAVKPATALIKAFEAKNPNIKIKHETGPQGAELDNMVKTRLATGEMNDVFVYLAGSLFQALKPESQLQALNDEPWVGKLEDSYKTAVSANDQVYGAPFGSAFGGGVLYNKNIYKKLGLEVPKTWDEFMANNAKIKKAGIDPVIQSYGETWTSQLFVLADFHNVQAAAPGWAEKYTANEVKYSQEPAIQGFRHLEEVNKAGYLNKNFGSVKFPPALSMLANGKGAHYPALTIIVPNLETSDPDKIDNVGFFAQPAQDEANTGMTLWLPLAAYIPKTTEGAKLDAAKKFLEVIASPEGCEVQSKAYAPTGPYLLKGCELPADVPAAVKDLQPYVDDGKVTPALEFLSPVTGPALEQITVEVGSGLRSADAGAKLYDKDVEKQAQQLGLEGW
jgi:raffinose/stachyose/melibiose transport system substrate-binding protein